MFLILNIFGLKKRKLNNILHCKICSTFRELKFVAIAFCVNTVQVNSKWRKKYKLRQTRFHEFKLIFFQ